MSFVQPVYHPVGSLAAWPPKLPIGISVSTAIAARAHRVCLASATLMVRDCKAA